MLGREMALPQKYKVRNKRRTHFKKERDLKVILYLETLTLIVELICSNINSASKQSETGYCT